jgi:RNA polymerase sigma factor (sigma-70 family)
MNQVQEEFDVLMQRVRQGSPQAIEELVERFGRHVLRWVRRKLNKSSKLRTKFDSTDFVQAVWASFFTVQPAHYNFDGPEALLAYLVNMARNKVVDAVRQRFMSLKYNVNRECSLEGSAAFQAAAVPARQPTPSQLAVAKEEWDRLLAQLSPQGQRMLTLRFEGHTYEEIAQQLHVDEKTVRRVLHKLESES